MAHVLLVDDHPDVAEILTQLLAARGHEVELCATAEDALERVSVRPPAVVIADQRLPGMSGIELISHLQLHAGGTPVILCSADDSLAEQAKEAGAFEFWVKGSEKLFDDVDRLADRLATRSH
jgi:two-component system, NtrC family, response regulator AtoC